MTDEMKDLIKERNRLYRRLKGTKYPDIHINYRKLRNLVQIKLRDALHKCNHQSIENGKNNIWLTHKKLKLITPRNKSVDHNFPLEEFLSNYTHNPVLLQSTFTRLNNSQNFDDFNFFL